MGGRHVEASFQPRQFSLTALTPFFFLSLFTLFLPFLRDLKPANILYSSKWVWVWV